VLAVLVVVVREHQMEAEPLELLILVVEVAVLAAY
jgi:hypothetical protein